MEAMEGRPVGRSIRALARGIGISALILLAHVSVLQAQTNPDLVYASQVRARLAQKESLEGIYERMYQRQQQLDSDMAKIQAIQDPNQRAYAVRQMQSVQDRNRQALERTRTRLDPIYRDLEGDAEKIQKLENPNVRQELGTYLGSVGLFGTNVDPASSLYKFRVVPIESRMTSAEAGGWARYGVNRTTSPVVGKLQGAAENVAANAASRAGNAESALLNANSITWKPAQNTSSGVWKLVPHDAATGAIIEGIQPRDTHVPLSSANGEGAASLLARQYDTRSAIGREIDTVRFKASQAINEKQQSFFERRASELEAKKAQIDESIAKHQSENPTAGARFKALAGDAARWGVMSAGMTLTSNVIGQLAANDWKLGEVSWSKAADFLVDKHWWGGTGGSFLGSMAGTMVASAIPGAGLAVKVAMSIGGASAGWAIGSGQAGKTDWLGLGISTLGSTAGFLIGMSIGGPVGAFIGGIVGQLATDWIYRSLKEWLTKEEASGGFDVAREDPWGTGSPNVPPGHEDPEYYRDHIEMGRVGKSTTAHELDKASEAMRRAYSEKIEAEKAGDATLAYQKQQEFLHHKARVEQMQQGVASETQSYGNFRDSR